jgi:DNA-directed RNA polymerase specialized sigma24 family protein
MRLGASWLTPGLLRTSACASCKRLTTGDRPGHAIPLAERIADPRTVELTVDAREALRSLAALRWRRRRALVLQAAGYSYKETPEKLGVTYTNVNRHITEGRAELRELRDAA